jgi:hypothetical protein
MVTLLLCTGRINARELDSQDQWLLHWGELSMHLAMIDYVQKNNCEGYFKLHEPYSTSEVISKIENLHSTQSGKKNFRTIISMLSRNSEVIKMRQLMYNLSDIGFNELLINSTEYNKLCSETVGSFIVLTEEKFVNLKALTISMLKDFPNGITLKDEI